MNTRLPRLPRILGCSASVLAVCAGAMAWLLPPTTAASKPPLPPARPVYYNPDPDICKPAALQSTFRQQLLPWSDQPAAVQDRLRQVQLEMLQATLQRCVSKGLLSPEAAKTVEQTLRQGSPDPVQPSGARP